MQYTATVNVFFWFPWSEFGGNNDSDIGAPSWACIFNSTFREQHKILGKNRSLASYQRVVEVDLKFKLKWH